MYNRFIFKIDVSRTAHTIRPYWLSSCSHYPIIIDGVFIQISSVARFTGCCGENTPLARDDDTVFLRLLYNSRGTHTHQHSYTYYVYYTHQILGKNTLLPAYAIWGGMYLHLYRDARV